MFFPHFLSVSLSLSLSLSLSPSLSHFRPHLSCAFFAQKCLSARAFALPGWSVRRESSSKRRRINFLSKFATEREMMKVFSWVSSENGREIEREMDWGRESERERERERENFSLAGVCRMGRVIHRYLWKKLRINFFLIDKKAFLSFSKRKARASLF